MLSRQLFRIGFSVIELFAVVGVIGILIGLILSGYSMVPRGHPPS